MSGDEDGSRVGVAIDFCELLPINLPTLVLCLFHLILEPLPKGVG
jgi:hypothetical protein